MDHLYIVVYKTHKDGKWNSLCDGEFEERRLAENLIEIKKAQRSAWEFAIVDGPIVSPKSMAEAEANIVAV